MHKCHEHNDVTQVSRALKTSDSVQTIACSLHLICLFKLKRNHPYTHQLTLSLTETKLEQLVVMGDPENVTADDEVCSAMICIGK